MRLLQFASQALPRIRPEHRVRRRLGCKLAQTDGQTLRGGWYPFDPYQYAVGKNEEKKLTGLDVQLVRAAFASVRREVRLDLVAWDQHQREIEDGRRDLAVGAFRTAEREQYALFSNAYRTERIVLYFRTKDSPAFAFSNDEELIRILESSPYRLGVTEGYFYGERLKRFIDDPRNAGRIVQASSDFDNFNNLLAGKIDAAPVDSLVGATLTWRHGWGDRIAVSEKAFFEEPVHVMFSRALRTDAPECRRRGSGFGGVGDSHRGRLLSFQEPDLLHLGEALRRFAGVNRTRSAPRLPTDSGSIASGKKPSRTPYGPLAGWNLSKAE